MSKTRETANIVSSGTAARLNVPSFQPLIGMQDRFLQDQLYTILTTTKLEFYNGTSWIALPGMSLGLTVALDG